MEINKIYKIILILPILCIYNTNINAALKNNPYDQGTKIGNNFDPLALITANADLKLKPSERPKKGIASKQTDFGAMAVPDQAKRIEIIKLEEDCQFDNKFIKVDYKEPVRFIVKNENSYPIKLTFTMLEKPEFFNENYKAIPILKPAKAFYNFNVDANKQHVFNWFFNRKKYFKWVCYNSQNSDIGISEIQVGNASKISGKMKKNDKFKNLPPPPIGF